MVLKITASHILVDKQSQALKILEELKKGVKFEELAKKYSTCPSRKRGGNLGSFSKGQMVKQFEKIKLILKIIKWN